LLAGPGVTPSKNWESCQSSLALSHTRSSIIPGGLLRTYEYLGQNIGMGKYHLSILVSFVSVLYSRERDSRRSRRVHRGCGEITYPYVPYNVSMYSFQRWWAETFSLVSWLPTQP
jgi:hypothetical protein